MRSLATSMSSLRGAGFPGRLQPQRARGGLQGAGWEWYHEIQRARLPARPRYRRRRANGDLAAFCTVWFDDGARTAYFEPVGTYTPYQRRGPGQGRDG